MYEDNKIMYINNNTTAMRKIARKRLRHVKEYDA